ncbi:hypothetical protein, partial [Thermodesulfobacterium commune]|uniref:hypothetical protein n=1 Tax=Thermodesulfobacterium commune TaxID=1741 RepID=UPI002FDA80F4
KDISENLFSYSTTISKVSTELTENLRFLTEKSSQMTMFANHISEALSNIVQNLSQIRDFSSETSESSKKGGGVLFLSFKRNKRAKRHL